MPAERISAIGFSRHGLLVRRVGMSYRARVAKRRRAIGRAIRLGPPRWRGATEAKQVFQFHRAAS